VTLVGENRATIDVKTGYTLTIIGDGTLIAEGGDDGWSGSPGIGGGEPNKPCGNIEILGGTIIARGGGPAAGAAAIGSNPGASYGNITIGPGVTEVIATVTDTTAYAHADPIGSGYGGGTGGTITVDPSLYDVTSEDGLTRRITRDAKAYAAAVASSAFETWKAEEIAKGASLSGAWDARDAKGVANVFRYVFDKADDEDFTESNIVLGFETDGNGAVGIRTLPVKNGTKHFSVNLVASDNVDGTGNTIVYPLSTDSDGITVISEPYNSSRYFRVTIDMK
jgi:hypothetical protein